MAKLASCSVLSVLASLCGCASTSSVYQEPQPAPVPAAPSGPSSWSIQVDIGVRDMHGDSWQGLDSQTAFDVIGVYAPHDWPMAVELGVAFDYDEGEFNGDDRLVSTFELSFGVRRELVLDERFSLVGAAGVFAAHTTDYVDDDLFDEEDIDGDFWGGVYAHGGVFVRVSKEIQLGLDARFASGSDVHVDGSDRGGDYSQLALAAILGI